MNESIDDWVFEGVLQFLKSPVWTVPVSGFIERHCHEFQPEEDENKLVYTALHTEFCNLVDDLLSTFLEEMGVPVEAFVDAVRRGRDDADSELAPLLSEYILALDDFPSFRAMMEKHNVEMELEAMYEYAKYTSQAADPADDMTDEERFLMEMAIHLSLGEHDVTLKQLEAEDAELLHALALSMAAEHERAVREELDENTVKNINDDIRAKRVENVERVVRQLQTDQKSPARARGDVERISTESPQKVAAQLLAPVGRQQGSTFSKGQAFKVTKPRDETPAAPATEPIVQQPTFDVLRREVEAKLNIDAPAPTADDIAKRAEYFKRQREILAAKKQAEREQELSKLKETVEVKASAGPTAAEEDRKAMTIALVRRFKDDLLSEARK